MGLLDDINDLKEAEGLIHLSRVTLITEELVQEPVWRALWDDYGKVTSPNKMCVISIFNAALTHNRRVFVLTRDGVEKLLKTDPNWPSPPTFNSKHWSKYLLFMYERKLLRKIHEGQASIYEVIFSPILESIPENLNHKLQAIEFAERKRNQKSNNQNLIQPVEASSENYESTYKPHVSDPKMLAEIEKVFRFNDFTDDDL